MIQGQSRKMQVEIGTPIQYTLRLGDERLDMSALVGQHIRLGFTGKINCISCGRRTKKSFAQGFCFPCMRNSPENSECIIRPELCRGHLGEGRDVQWELDNHVQEHLVYLAASVDMKVGVTRGDQIPTRWIDQGASQARVIARTPHRCAAGEIEVALKEAFTDRTSWQKMLKNDVLANPDWDEALRVAKATMPATHLQYWAEDEPITILEYPVHAYPQKVTSLSFDKTDTVEGQLMGIKGQYLLFDGNRVLNVRKHNGYDLTCEAL